MIVAQCEVAIADPKNGIVTCSQENEHGSVCKFYCDQGYTLAMNNITDTEKLYEEVSHQIFAPTGGSLKSVHWCLRTRE